MQTFFHAVSAALVVLLLTATGYILGRIGHIRPEHKGMITKLAINVGLPCMCLNNLTANFTHDSLMDAGKLLLAPTLNILLCTLISIVAARLLRLPHKRRGVFIIMSAFSNSVFIGIPMCTELFGEASLAYVMCYYLINTTLFQTIGVAIITQSGKPEGEQGGFLRNLGEMLKRPPLIALLVALAMVWADIPLPGIIQSYTGYMAGLLTPLGLIYSGYIIYEHGLKNIRMERGMLTMMFLRFLVSPIMAIAACWLMGVQGMAQNVFVVEAALPTMTQTVVFAALLGADENYAALGSAITTIACFGVVPLLMLVL